MIKDYNAKIGCFWNKQGNNGDYMSGELVLNGEKHRIVAFKRDKRNEKEPDWDIKFSKPMEGVKVDPDTLEEVIN